MVDPVASINIPETDGTPRESRVGNREVRKNADLNDLTARLRRPKRWMLRHPLRAARRQRTVVVMLIVVGVVAGFLANRRRQDIG